MRDDSIPTDGASRETHPSEGLLAAYLDGELEDADLARLELHLDVCAECRALLARASSVLAVAPEVTSEVVHRATPVSGGSGRSRSGVLPWATLALAASLTMIVVSRRDPTTSEEERVRTVPFGAGEGTPVLVTHLPPNGAALPRAGLRFIWAWATAERFAFVLSDETGQPVYSSDTRDSMLTLPDSVTLQAGRSYFWRVDAIGGGVAATTRSQRFSIERPR